MRIFIAGKYGSHELPSDVRLSNVHKAIDAARELIKLGHSPFCPHLSHFVHEDWGWEGSTPECWYKIDNEWLSCADAVLMLDNWQDSPGAMAELALAIRLFKPVYLSIQEVPNAT